MAARRVKRTPRRSSPTETTLTEDAYRLVKWQITTVQLAPGVTFTEADLAKQLQLSRTPLREALLILRREGFVTVEGRSGYRVAAVTLRDVHDLASVRRSLEGDAADAAATRLVEPGQMASLVERAPSTVLAGDSAAWSLWIEADRRFHLAIAVAAGNQHLVGALDPILEKSARLLHLAVMWDLDTATAAHDHTALISALHERDGARARDAITCTIDEMENSVSRALMASPSLLTASLVLEPPRNQFYLDVAPTERAASPKPAASHASNSRRNTPKRVEVRR